MESINSGYIDELKSMTVNQLQDRYYEVFCKATATRNRQWLMRRIYYRFQELRSGIKLSAEAQKQLEALMKKQAGTIRRAALPPLPELSEKPRRDPRLPPPGSFITKKHRQQTYQIKVLDDGFEVDGQRFKTLSAVARAITGMKWNGFAWAGLSRRVPMQEDGVNNA